MSWITRNPGYAPDLEYGAAIENDALQFQDSLLSQDTLVRRLYRTPGSATANLDEMSETKFQDFLEQSNAGTKDGVQILFVYKFLMKSNVHNVPLDPNKLRICPRSFEALCLRYRIPNSFTFALSRYYLPSCTGYRIGDPREDGTTSYDLWYFLPVRIQVDCTDKRGGHTSSTAGRNQMDPFHYLHLTDCGVDLRGSTIAVFTRYDLETRDTTVITFNFMDGRWARVAEEPQTRIHEVMDHPKCSVAGDALFSHHTVYLTSVIRWWTNSLSSVNEQLIAFEKRLQDESNSATPTSPVFYNTLNKALHSMAAHLHRYQSDLNSIATTAAQIRENWTRIESLQDRKRATGTGQCIDQISMQIGALKDFARELEKKSSNNLALLFNQMQITGNRLQLDNGQAMYEILRATEAEAKMSRAMAVESQKLAQEMKKDSLAMRAIAVVTMFFLPGATFAALLSMPFLQQNPWLSHVARIWVWLVLTVPSTLLAFGFYYYCSWQNEQRNQRDEEALVQQAGKIA